MNEPHQPASSISHIFVFDDSMTGNNARAHGNCTGESQHEDRRLHRSDTNELVLSNSPQRKIAIDVPSMIKL